MTDNLRFRADSVALVELTIAASKGYGVIGDRLNPREGREK